MTDVITCRRQEQNLVMMMMMMMTTMMMMMMMMMMIMMMMVMAMMFIVTIAIVLVTLILVLHISMRSLSLTSRRYGGGSSIFRIGEGMDKSKNPDLGDDIRNSPPGELPETSHGEKSFGLWLGV